MSCKIKNIRFVKNYEDYWNGIDVLITANPKALESKPENKISVKINTSYNDSNSSDFTLDSILEFIKDEELRDNILNKQITIYE